MIQSVERALEILELIAHAGGAERLTDIAARAGLKSTTAHNLLKTLVALGYVRRYEDDTRYHLGERILNLSRVAGHDSDLRQRLRPSLVSMSEQTGETVFIAAPSGDEVYFLDAIESRKPLRASGQAGQRAPMAGSAIGLLFLALDPRVKQYSLETHAERLDNAVEDELKAIADRGYALDQDNYEQGLSCIAVP